VQQSTTRAFAQRPGSTTVYYPDDQAIYSHTDSRPLDLRTPRFPPRLKGSSSSSRVSVGAEHVPREPPVAKLPVRVQPLDQT
jgi:hypothetical protein